MLNLKSSSYVELGYQYEYCRLLILKILNSLEMTTFSHFFFLLLFLAKLLLNTFFLIVPTIRRFFSRLTCLFVNLVFYFFLIHTHLLCFLLNILILLYVCFAFYFSRYIFYVKSHVFLRKVYRNSPP